MSREDGVLARAQERVDAELDARQVQLELDRRHDAAEGGAP